MEFVTEADVVLIGSGVRTRDAVAGDRLISRLTLDPSRQLIGAQCSGALVLARLGLLAAMPACTDIESRPFVEACGVIVLDAPFHAEGNIATAGGCLSSQYLATWLITRTPRGTSSTTWLRSARTRRRPTAPCAPSTRARPHCPKGLLGLGRRY